MWSSLVLLERLLIVSEYDLRVGVPYELVHFLIAMLPVIMVPAEETLGMVLLVILLNKVMILSCVIRL